MIPSEEAPRERLMTAVVLLFAFFTRFMNDRGGSFMRKWQGIILIAVVILATFAVGNARFVRQHADHIAPPVQGITNGSIVGES